MAEPTWVREALGECPELFTTWENSDLMLPSPARFAHVLCDMVHGLLHHYSESKGNHMTLANGTKNLLQNTVMVEGRRG